MERLPGLGLGLGLGQGCAMREEAEELRLG